MIYAERIAVHVERAVLTVRGRTVEREIRRLRPRGPDLVLAGNVREAHFYAAKLLLPRGWQPITDPYTCMGFRNPVVYVVGSYFKRRDLDGIRRSLIPADPTFRDEGGAERGAF